MEQQLPPTRPVMTTLAGRPIKILHAPGADILISCRTAEGEDVHVPLTALVARIGQDMVSELRKGGHADGSSR